MLSRWNLKENYEECTIGKLENQGLFTLVVEGFFANLTIGFQTIVSKFAIHNTYFENRFSFLSTSEVT